MPERNEARKAFVAGWPIAHSLSPLMHSHWLATNGIEGTYEAVSVAPDRFGSFLASLSPRIWRGGNVTIPHKEAALAAAAWCDEEARAIGAANTLWFEGGRLCAANTDAYGFAANLDERTPGWARAETAVVLGAGGAARAVIHAILQRGFAQVTVINRTRERADELVRHFGAGTTSAGWDRLPVALAEAGLLVNTTSLGMDGQPQLDIDLSLARRDLIVTDAVYVPLMTPILCAATAAGLAAVDGLGMLMHQGAPGFEKWFGTRPKVTPELRALLVGELERRQAQETAHA
jgi:shikimate dehydrogenase